MFKDFFESLINLIKFITINKNEKEFVLYSESKFYREHFIDLIINLKKYSKNIVIITSDRDDLIFYNQISRCLYIKNYLILNVFFKILNCKFMIMTLTDLGSHLVRSKSCRYYVYFFHATASTHKIYTHTAFKNYDIILSNGEYQTKELIEAEEKFNFPKKEIINSGYFFLDNIKNKANLKKTKKRQILLAPSWNYNKNNLFDDHLVNLISNLLSNNFFVTLRPHPEHYKRSINIIDKINNLYSKNNNFFFDKNLSNLNSLEEAQILITDNSSIVLEFMLVFKRPIIFVEYTDKIHNSHREEILINTIEDEFKNIFGNKLDISNLNNISELCENLLIKSNISIDSIEAFEKKYFSNLNNSASFAAKYLINKSKEVH